MPAITPADLKNIADYEKIREVMRAEVIALKKRRRVHVGPNLTFLFENRQTVLFQIQEMMRTERIVHDDKVQDEIDAYAPLLPGQGEVSATLFIEIPDLFKLSQATVRETVNRFQGIDKDAVFLEVGRHRLPARFEGGQSKEEKMAAVHYLRFPLSMEARVALADLAQPARILVEHTHYGSAVDLTAELRGELLGDLTA